MITSNIANSFFALLTIGGQALIVLGIISTFIFRTNQSKNIIREFMRTYGMQFAFIVALGAVSGSLLYSEVLNLEPCKLCWLQRIFMFPQTIILGLALLKKDKNIADYAIALSTIGILISIYHYYLQISGVTNLPCSAGIESGGCSTQLVSEFGYITIPLMAITTFALIIFSLLYVRKKP